MSIAAQKMVSRGTAAISQRLAIPLLTGMIRSHPTASIARPPNPVDIRKRVTTIVRSVREQVQAARTRGRPESGFGALPTAASGKRKSRSSGVRGDAGVSGVATNA